MRIKKILIVISLLLVCFLIPSNDLIAQGKFEIGFHYSRWSIDILRGFIETGLSEAMEPTLRDDFLSEIRNNHPELDWVSYSHNVSFDSSGDNFGVEVRWYPGGQYGSFSIGLSVEKTTMEISIPDLSSSMDLDDGSTFSANSKANFVIDPISFHLSFRWDVSPYSRIHPYFTLGVGAATGTALEEAEFTYEYNGVLNFEGDDEPYSGGDTKTLQELKEELEEEEEEDFFLPGFIPFIQINLGLKAVLTENLHMLVDAGIWNGFLIRGGIALRF